MAKDPAFLFYYQDFLVGIDHMTDEQVGQYVKCMCHQANRGTIRSEHMKNICKTHDNHMIVLEKFVEERKGEFYNVRLRFEMDRRKAYSRSRRENRKGEVVGKELFLEYVFLSKVEHEKLLKGMGKNTLKDYLERLNGYLGASSKNLKKYTSHYHTILNWWRKDGKKISQKDIDENNKKEFEEKYCQEVAEKVQGLVNKVAGGME